MQENKEGSISQQKLKRSLVARLFYTVEIQQTFSDDEIAPDPEGEDGDFEPTEKALVAFGAELANYLGEIYLVGTVTINDSETLGIETELSSDFFGDVRPPTCRTNIELPNPEQPRTALWPESFPLLCDYFIENGMSFHAADLHGDIVLFSSNALEECPIVLQSQWGFTCETPEPEYLHLNLVIHDVPGDPLSIPFVFNATNPQHAYEMIRLVEQEVISFNLLTVHDNNLYLFEQRKVQIPEDFREIIAMYARDALRNVQAAK